jgi:hypothetical protein
LIPLITNKFGTLSTTLELRQDEIFCLEIAWYWELPSELKLDISNQTHTFIQRHFDISTFKFEWKTRLTENLSSNAIYNVTLSFKTYGGVDEVSFCSKKGICRVTFFIHFKTSLLYAVQIIRAEENLKGCQLMTKVGQVEQTVYESSNCSESPSAGEIN